MMNKTTEIIKKHTQLNEIDYLVKSGSHAYGTNNSDSDIDIYGFCVPSLEIIFPHTAGKIAGFDRQIQNFEQAQTEILLDEQLYDINIYNIIKFFRLAMDNNPNIIDMLFVPSDCVIYLSEIGELVRRNRHTFLHKGSYRRTLGYAFSQFKKIKNKNPVGKRKAIVDKYGYDVKYATHLYRLLLECEQILLHCDLDLRKHSDILLSVRQGKYSLEEIESWFENKKVYLENLYNESKLPDEPKEQEIKKLLIECLEIKYGKLNKWGFSNAK